MSTRASLRFKDTWDTFFVYRHSYGYPDGEIPRHIESAIEKARGRWSGSECGLFVSLFLGLHFNEQERLPDYMMTSGVHGDESYHYFIEWNDDDKKWAWRYEQVSP